MVGGRSVREATAAIFRFIHGKTFEDYEQDELLRSGIERKFEIIGEALNRIRRDDPRSTRQDTGTS